MKCCSIQDHSGQQTSGDFRSIAARWLTPKAGSLDDDSESIQLRFAIERAKHARQRWLESEVALREATINSGLGFRPTTTTASETLDKGYPEFNPDQPRWPAGDSDSRGGQWRPGDGDSGQSRRSGQRTLLPFTRRSGSHLKPLVPVLETDIGEPFNPFPEDPECAAEWEVALDWCRKQRALSANRRAGNYGPSFYSCVLGRVSQRCGGSYSNQSAETQDTPASPAMALFLTSTRIRPIERRRNSFRRKLKKAWRLTFVDLRHEEAVAICTKVIEADPGNVDAYKVRASANESLKRSDYAIADWDRVEALGEACDAIYFGRAMVKYRRGRYQEAITDFDRAEAIDRENYFADTIWLYRADCYNHLGLYDAALADCAKIPHDDPFPGFRHKRDGSKRDIIAEIKAKRGY